MSNISVPIPAPKPIAMIEVRTTSGNVLVPCEPIGDWFAVTAEFAMDDEGNTVLTGKFGVTHRPTGSIITLGTACVECARSAAKALAAMDTDWSTIRDGSKVTWTTKQQKVLAVVRPIEWVCDAEDCEPWNDQVAETAAEYPTRDSAEQVVVVELGPAAGAGESR